MNADQKSFQLVLCVNRIDFLIRVYLRKSAAN
jgi:hypothetical protein